MKGEDACLTGERRREVGPVSAPTLFNPWYSFPFRPFFRSTLVILLWYDCCCDKRCVSALLICYELCHWVIQAGLTVTEWSLVREYLKLLWLKECVLCIFQVFEVEWKHWKGVFVHSFRVICLHDWTSWGFDLKRSWAILISPPHLYNLSRADSLQWPLMWILDYFSRKKKCLMQGRTFSSKSWNQRILHGFQPHSNFPIKIIKVCFLLLY